MKKCKLGDIAEFKTGPFGTQFKASEYTNSGYPVINVKNIGIGRIIEDDIEYVSEETRNRLSDHIIHEGDIVFARKGSVERHTYVRKEHDGWVQGSDCIKAKIDKGIDSRYISYYLCLDSVKKQLLIKAVGSTMPSMNTDILKDISVALPENNQLEVQIADFFDRINEKILINEKTIDTLESMAKTLYDYWFVQFDFPDANGRPYKTSGGKMEWNETLSREIPAGWEVKKLSSLCELKNGINYDKSVKGDKLYRIVNVRNITATSLLVDEQDLDEIKLLSKQAEKYLVGDNDILIARSGNPGAVRLLTNNHNVIYCGFIICCQVLSEMLKLYLTFTLKKYEGTNLTKTGGSIMQNVSQDTLNSIDVIVPPQDIIQVYNEKVISMVEKIKRLVEETNKLANLRDFLLPMLMNGQVTFRQ